MALKLSIFFWLSYLLSIYLCTCAGSASHLITLPHSCLNCSTKLITSNNSANVIAPLAKDGYNEIYFSYKDDQSRLSNTGWTVSALDLSSNVIRVRRSNQNERSENLGNESEFAVNNSVDIQLNGSKGDNLKKNYKSAKLVNTKHNNVVSGSRSLIIGSENTVGEALMLSTEPRDTLNDAGSGAANNDDSSHTNGQPSLGNDHPIKTKTIDTGVSPLLEGEDLSPVSNADISGSSNEHLQKIIRPRSRSSWLAIFLCNGRGPGWFALNITLLVFIILSVLLCLFRLLALRSCTPLLSRTIYLVVLLLCFMGAAFTGVHLVHLCFGGNEGLPILLTLMLTHTPALCFTTALVLLLHRILRAARLPWSVSCSTLGKIGGALIVMSVVGDVAVTILPSPPFLLTCRATLTALSLIPLILYIIRYCKIIKVSDVLRRELNGELKLMVPPPKDSIAHEQNLIRAVLRDVLAPWANLLLICCILTIVLWACNLSMSVFFSVSNVPIWVWWVFHTTNIISQILIILFLVFSCVITQDGHHLGLWHKLFIIPKDILNPPTTGTANEQRNFVYERVSYSSGPESSQRTSSSHNETDDTDGRILQTSLNPQSSPSIRPRVTLQRSATFNCAPRIPMMYGYYPGYPHILPQGYPRTSSYAQINPPYGSTRAMVPSMLLQEGGFVRFNMPVQGISYPVHMKTREEMIREAELAQMHPPVDIEYNSLRRFPRKYQTKEGPTVLNGESSRRQNKFNPHEIRIPTPGSAQSQSPGSLTQPLMPIDPTTPAAIPVSPYHAIPFLPTQPYGVPMTPTSVFQTYGQPSSSVQIAGRVYQSPPPLPSRVGSFRNHFSAVGSPVSAATSPLPSPYHAMPAPAASSGMVSPYSPIPMSSESQKLPSSRPTSPPITTIAFPPPPTSVPIPSVIPEAKQDLKTPESLQKIGDSSLVINHQPNKYSSNSPEGNYTNSSLTATSSSPDKYPADPLDFSPNASTVPSRSGSVTSIPYSKAEMQLHQEKSIESTVREILSSGERPLIRPRRHPLHSSIRSARRNQLLQGNNDPEIYANTSNVDENGFEGSNSAVTPNSSNNPMDAIFVVPDKDTTDGVYPNDEVRNVAPSLKRNHSTAGCYYPKERKDSTCQTDDEGNKYSSFRLSQLRSKPADWYGTWAGRRKSKNGAYSIDPNKDNQVAPTRERDNEKRLSSSRASLLSIYSKLKNRKEKTPKDGSGDETEKDDRDEIELSHTSTSAEETPTPSETTDGASLAPEEEKDEDDLDNLKEVKEPDADWTLDILSSSTVLSDFYKLKSERPPPLPEVSEVEA